MLLMKNSVVRIIALFALALAAASESRGNALSVTNLSIISASGGIADVQFDISWSNSWDLSWSEDGGATTVHNWDAAWVFLKFKTPSSTWRHGLLSSTGHIAPSGSRIDVVSNDTNVYVGAFIRRSAQGSGSFVVDGVRLRWDYGSSGLGGTNDVDVSIHAIEMVYIPEGAFALGSGGGDSGTFFEAPTSSNPYWVTNDLAIPTGVASGLLWGSVMNSGQIPAVFPKGHAPFYTMKYEISQGQYASFLNFIDPGQAVLRYPDYYNQNRFSIRLVNDFYTADAPDRACNWLNVTDVLGYLAWAGLRPMTELEFEKICRGTIPPEPNEYAWGSSSITSMTGFSGVDGSGAETALPVAANANYGGAQTGPVRVGIFSEAGSSRQTSGASYYGVMDMSGSLGELAVSVSSSEGLAFIPSHGWGIHTPLPGDWPSYTGLLRRGGHWQSTSTGLRTSARDTGVASTRASTYGGRGVRTAPSL